MAGTQVSTLRLVPARTAPPSSPPVRSRFRGARVVAASRLGRRGVGQILDTSMDVLVERFGICVGIATLIWLPFQVGTELVLRSKLPDEFLLVWTATAAAPQLITTAFVCTLVGGHLVGRRVAPGEAIASGIGRFPGMVVISIFNVIAAVVLLCPCVFTTNLAHWLFSVVPVVYVIERGRLLPRGGSAASAPLFGWLAEAFQAMARGIRLVWGWGSFARWMGWFVVAKLALVAPLTAIPSLFEVPEIRDALSGYLKLQGPVGFLIVAIGALFLGIGTAYMAVVMTVYYVDERVRKEGLDLELALRRLGQRGEAETA